MNVPTSKQSSGCQNEYGIIDMEPSAVYNMPDMLCWSSFECFHQFSLHINIKFSNSSLQTSCIDVRRYWCDVWLPSLLPNSNTLLYCIYTTGSNVLHCPGALSLWNYSLIGNTGSLTALAPRYSHIPNERGRLTAGVGAIQPMTPRFCL